MCVNIEINDKKKEDMKNEDMKNEIFKDKIFMYKELEDLANESADFNSIEKAIKNALSNTENCSKENLASIKAYRDAAGSRGNTPSLFVALASFGISTLSLAYSSIKITDSDIKFFKIIAFLIAVATAYGVHYVLTKKTEKLQFAYSYLINMMEIKLQEPTVEKLENTGSQDKECNSIEAEDAMEKISVEKIETQGLEKELKKRKNLKNKNWKLP